MQDQPVETITKILELIGYQGDKQAFANQFLANSQKQALVDLLDSLPADKQAQLKQQLSTAQQVQIPDLLQSYFTKEQYLGAVTKATKEAFGSFLETIKSSLTDAQAGELQTFLSSLADTQKVQPQSY